MRQNESGRNGLVRARWGWRLLLLALAAVAPACRGASTGPAPSWHASPSLTRGSAYAATYFEHHGTNPTCDTRDEKTSTFAMDVDDGSYTLARTYLEQGKWPERDGVRVEEFVNHFDYRYPAPVPGALTLVADGAPSPFVPDAHVLRFAVQAGAVPAFRPVPHVVLFLVDVSGSMDRESRLSLVKYCVLHLAQRMRPEDRVALVTFADDARLVLPPTPVRDRDRIWRAVRGLQAGGSTNLRAGLDVAFETFRDWGVPPDAPCRVVLCSDGVANVGDCEIERLAGEIRRQRHRDVHLSAVGFGLENYHDALLERLGTAGDGNYAYVGTQQDVERVFGYRFLRTSAVAARDVKVQVEFDPGNVRTWRLLGYENRDVPDEAFHDPWQDGGELGTDQSATALYEVRLQPGATGRVATYRVHHTDPQTGCAWVDEREVLVSDLAPFSDQADSGFRVAVAAAGFAEILRESHWVRGLRLEDVLGTLTGIGRLERGVRTRDVDELHDLVRLAIRVRGWKP